MDKKLVETFYGEHIGKSFWEKLRAFSMSGPMIALLLEGENAVEVVRKINGPTNPAEAPEGTIRGDYGTGVKEPTNAVHGSATAKDALREINLLFPVDFTGD